jgi:malate dehydrogenase (oxaloacetate-decarboxylating)(NADP+)
MAAYRQHLISYVCRSGTVMASLFQTVQQNSRAIAFSEGEEERVLQTVQILVNEGLARPTLVGRREVIEHRIQSLGLRLKLDEEVKVVDPTCHTFYAYDEHWMLYHRLMERKGVSPETAQRELRGNTSVVAALLALRGEVDCVICGPVFHYARQVKVLEDLLGRDPQAPLLASLSSLVLEAGTLFFADAYVNEDPTARQLAEIACMSAKAVQHFGLVPRIAFVSHSNFGSNDTGSASKMRDALEHLRELNPRLEAEGELNVDVALDPLLRQRIFPNARLTADANLFIMPNVEAAHIAFNTAKGVSGGQPIGPLLLGLQKPVHVLTPSVTVRGILNMAVLAASGLGPCGSPGQLKG